MRWCGAPKGGDGVGMGQNKTLRGGDEDLILRPAPPHCHPYTYPGVLSQATKNKTYTPKNICSSASKDRSHGEYLALA